jgi:hypothetical protein
VSDPVEAVLAGRLEEWRGLPRGLSAADLAPAIDAPDDAPAMAALGMRQALVLFGEASESGSGAEVWVSPEDREVWYVALDDPAFVGEPSSIRSRLGAPALELDTMLGTVPMPAAEWVYPERGIAVYADVEDARVWRLALFGATTAAAYGQLYAAAIGRRRRPDARF